MHRLVASTLLLGGCGGRLDPQSGVVLDGFSFGWDLFNHRLSYLLVEPEGGSARVAVIGGTSTTSERPEIADECEAGCSEFPFEDRSLVDLCWSVLQSDRAALVPFTVDLEVGADGVTSTVEVELPSGAKGEATALLSGLVLDTDHELATGPACYEPRFGWHVRRLAVALGTPTLEGGAATVPVSATFAAGNANDPERTCIDEVNEQAVVAMTVRGLLLVGRDLEVEEHHVSSSAAFPFSGDLLDPGEQVPPEPEQVDLGLEATAAGLASMDWTFYPEAADGQGAYLRTFGWTVATDGTVGASATNYSPGTQLEDFAYEVDLTARFVAFDGTVVGHEASAELRTEIEADGKPVVHEVEAAR